MVNAKGNIICILVCKGTAVGRRWWAAASLNCNVFISGICYKENVFFLFDCVARFSLSFLAVNVSNRERFKSQNLLGMLTSNFFPAKN